MIMDKKEHTLDERMLGELAKFSGIIKGLPVSAQDSLGVRLRLVVLEETIDYLTDIQVKFDKSLQELLETE